MKAKVHPRILEMANKFDLPVHEFTMRNDGRVEWECRHGTGHTVFFPMGSTGSHGCCGCCSKLKEVKKHGN